ncbi:hypothetical protein [uncultured Sphingomonas sp.]|uniref:hypothetical protein n=1 Tax=uncultured Sphingomonas sp. TaxID=158754 RepID=UPI0035CA3C4D
MDRQYLLSRMNASLIMANKTEDSIARLVHLDLAGRYSVAAAAAETPSVLAPDHVSTKPIQLNEAGAADAQQAGFEAGRARRAAG